MSRQTETVRWLATSSIALPLRHGRGFFALRGFRIRLADGTLLDALDWLQTEGFMTGVVLDGYSVAYTPVGGNYAERLTFFEMRTMDIPFAKPPRLSPAAALLSTLRSGEQLVPS
ncbi:MAG TPA: hypothetical protein PLE42_04320 [Candidatus Competibacteraceae bacterium]|nr:MAG: hypothetical protein EKK69_00750 [Candidatus Competibacteraceae bacterium]HQC71927.1 hypothetical protein [Candidatus Competibacteraceae bacterium]